MKNKIFTIAIFLFTLLSVFAFFNFFKQTQATNSESNRYDLSHEEVEEKDLEDPKDQNPLSETSQTKSQEDIPIAATSAIIIDANTKDTLYAKNIEEKKSIASLTKLATALIFLENNPKFDKKECINEDEYTIGSTLRMEYGEEITTRDLFGASIVGSANNATNALARSSGISEESFVEKMNQLVKDLKLDNTTFYEVTGLEPKNQSTAKDYALLALHAFSNSEIKKISALPYYDFNFLNSERFHRIKNPNDLVRTRPDLNITASKTGYLDEAKYCLALEFEKQGKKYIAIILDSPSETDQYEDAISLITNI